MALMYCLNSAIFSSPCICHGVRYGDGRRGDKNEGSGGGRYDTDYRGSKPLSSDRIAL